MFSKGKPKPRTNVNVEPNFLLEWLHLLGKRGADKQISFSDVSDERELVFSGRQEKSPVFSRENYVLILKIIG